MFNSEQPNQATQKKVDEKIIVRSPSKPVLFGSAMMSGLIEVAVFHPADTIAKRQQLYPTNLFIPGQSFAQWRAALNKVIFREAYNKSFAEKFSSLFHGGLYAGVYKALQQTYRFGGQAVFAEYLNHHYGDTFKNVFGEKSGKIMTEAVSGSFVAVGESIFLPIDNIKTKLQNNKAHYKQIGIWNLAKSEGFNLYNGLGVTLLRNVPGTFALFGVSAFVKQKYYQLENPKDATLKQHFFAAAAGAGTAIMTTNFADVVKTRVQSRQGKVSTLNIFKEILKKEGLSAFFKGTSVRMITVAPKITLTMTMAQSLPKVWGRFFAPQENTIPAESNDTLNHKMITPKN